MTYSEEMEKLGQVTIFDLLPSSSTHTNIFSIGDRVRVVITAESDPESYYYLESYLPIVFKKRGEIIEVLGNQLYLVDFAGERHLFKEHEIAL